MLVAVSNINVPLAECFLYFLLVTTKCPYFDYWHDYTGMSCVDFKKNVSSTSTHNERIHTNRRLFNALRKKWWSLCFVLSCYANFFIHGIIPYRYLSLCVYQEDHGTVF